MNKKQTDKFNSLFEDTLGWGDESEYGVCLGLFKEFGDALGQVATGIDESTNTITVYWCPTVDQQYNIDSFPINSTTKRTFKKIMEHLMTKDKK